ncbi:MAG: hypothetical protein H0V51_05095 [Chloroflexi bacterium]|nr:hypothetical protein [Chloroflexota bacterium]
MSDDRVSPPDAAALPLPPEVAEAEARDEIARIYEEIRQALRSPNVNLVYRLLASYPPYLAAAWEQVRPNLASRYVEREAERLRALGPLDIGSSGASFRRDLAALGLPDDELGRIRATIDLFNYANPKNLIVVTALHLALDGRPIPGSGDPEAGRRVPEGPLPAVEVRLLDARSASPEARAVLDEILAAHDTAGAMPSVYRALAGWPAFLRLTWETLRPLVAGAEIAKRVRRLIDEAERSALGLPHPLSLSRAEAEPLIGPNGTAAVGAVLQRFRTGMIPPMIVEIHTLKALLDGADAARRSPLAWRAGKVGSG